METIDKIFEKILEQTSNISEDRKRFEMLQTAKWMAEISVHHKASVKEVAKRLQEAIKIIGGNKSIL